MRLKNKQNRLAETIQIQGRVNRRDSEAMRKSGKSLTLNSLSQLLRR